MKSAIRQYQLILMYPISLSEKEQKDDLKKVEDQIKSEEVKVTFKDWGEKELEYPIKKQVKARFWIGTIATSGDKSVMDWSSFKLYLNRNKNIMRYLILKI